MDVLSGHLSAEWQNDHSRIHQHFRVVLQLWYIAIEATPTNRLGGPGMWCHWFKTHTVVKVNYPTIYTGVSPFSQSSKNRTAVNGNRWSKKVDGLNQSWWEKSLSGEISMIVMNFSLMRTSQRVNITRHHREDMMMGLLVGLDGPGCLSKRRSLKRYHGWMDDWFGRTFAWDGLILDLSEHG